MGLCVVDLDGCWDDICDLFDPEPYRKAFMLENMVLGTCCLSYGRECYLTKRHQGLCRILFDSWPLACYCGPEFVRKYKIKPKGGDDTDAGHTNRILHAE